MAPVFAHANMRDGGPDRLAQSYHGELSQGVALERVSVVKDTASALYDWKKLSLVIVKPSPRGQPVARIGRRFYARSCSPGIC